MLNRNFASTSAMIARANDPKIEALPQVDMNKAILGAIDSYYKISGEERKRDEEDRKKGLEEALGQAIERGDENAINVAYGKLDPTGYVDYLNRVKANREASDLEFERQKELLDIKNQNAMGLARLKDALGGTPTSAARNYEYLKSLGYSDDIALAASFGEGTEAVGNTLASGGLSKKGVNSYNTTMGKAQAERDAANQDYLTLLPKAQEAISRGRKATKSGAGLGPIQGRLGSIGIATQQGSENQADITAANSQMNAILRQKLAATGLTGSELNSAIEAQAYRYTVDPTMPVSYINKQFDNFINDYLQDNSVNPKTPVSLNMNDPKIRAAKEAGYTDEEIQEYLRGRNG